MAASVTALEAKTRFGQLLDRVSQGEEVIVTRHDKPVARIVPAGRPAREEVRAAVEGLRQLRRTIAMRRGTHPALTDDDIKSLIEEGRR
ncbi:MAG: type II toxin-antitoxin system prevent-host-death family antitoxin [Gammaproteobacteria bacterium]|nr:type II toxin-antitoxin system prevent-host-death family antitoxin [Gammaproteobacteria bacterium]MDE0272908.1 type II toxin-antitoxin system prevent-host-death family antitoxin [Gammaproteobacteria bacterium]